MRHFEQIQEKVTQLEKRHQQREQELQQMIRNFQQVASVELQEEVSKWKNIVEMKNREIQKFRAELDSILDVLRVLQSQGVVLPVRSFHSWYKPISRGHSAVLYSVSQQDSIRPW